MAHKLGGSKYTWTLCLLALGTLFGVEWIQRKQSPVQWVSAQPRIVRWTVYAGLVFLIIAFGRYGGDQQFIYFQF
jgi:hypothetical protein